MIELKDLKNKEYDKVGKGGPIAWDYFLTDIDLGKDKVDIRFMFQKDEEEGDCSYIVTAIVGLTDFTNTVYKFRFTIPKRNMNLNLITAMGLTYMQAYLKEEVQLKSLIDFEIGEVLKGM